MGIKLRTSQGVIEHCLLLNSVNHAPLSSLEAQEICKARFRIENSYRHAKLQGSNSKPQNYSIFVSVVIHSVLGIFVELLRIFGKSCGQLRNLCVKISDCC